MPFVPVPDTVMVEIVYELDNQVCENTLYYRTSSTIDEASIHDLLVAIRDVIESELLPLLSSALKLVRLVGTLMEAADSLSVILSVVPPVAGGNTQLPLPNNDSYAITFKTPNRGRSARGRNFIVGLTHDAVVGNTLNPTFRADLTLAYIAISSAGDAMGFNHVVVSRFSGVTPGTGKPIPRTTGVTYPVNAIATFDAVVDSQRRRLPGRGK